MTELILVSFRSNVNIHYAFTENLLTKHREVNEFTLTPHVSNSPLLYVNETTSHESKCPPGLRNLREWVILFIKYPLNCAANTTQTPTDFQWRFDEKKSLKRRSLSPSVNNNFPAPKYSINIEISDLQTTSQQSVTVNRDLGNSKWYCEGKPQNGDVH